MIQFDMWYTQIGSKSLRIQINRMSQLERTVATTHPLFRCAQGLICVCDVTDADSFEYLKTFVPQVTHL
jgi:NADH/NAD ratio-sensing transcriptional regulator Rex